MPRKKPSVAIVHYSCPPVVGGVEVIVEAHAKLFAEAGYPTRVIVGKGGALHPDVQTVLVPEIVSAGGPLGATLKQLASATVPKRFDAQVTRVVEALRRALRGVDVCFMHNVLTMHFNMVLTAALARVMAEKSSTRFVAWTHDLSFADPRYAAYCKESYPWNLLKTKLEGCDYCVISKQRQEFANKIMGVPRTQLPIVPDGISLPGFLELTPRVASVWEREQLDEVDVVAVTPARVLPRKRLEFGIEIVAALKRAGVSVKWLVTGAPDVCNTSTYQQEIVDLVKCLRVEENVVFVGNENGKAVRLSDEDVHSLYAVADVCIFASQQEGFGIPVLEAGLAQNVLVLSRIPVLREIADRASGCEVVWVPEKGARRRGTSLETLGRKQADAVAGRVATKVQGSSQFRFRKTVIARYSWGRLFRTQLEPMVLDASVFWPTH